MKKILFSLVTVLMGVLLFSSCANDDQLGVDKYNAYKENFEKVFAQIHPGQNFNTQQTLAIQSTTGKQGNYTLKVYDGAPGKKSTSLLGKFENLNGTSVSTVKVGVSKSLKNIYCVADDGSTSRLATVKITPKGDAIPDFEDIPINIPTNGPTNANTVTIAFEDLGATDDFDFNDVVITVDYVTGERTATVTLLALGGVLPVRLSYVSRTADFSKELFEGKELHEAMGYDTKTMINTNCETTGGVTGVDNVAPITDEITVPADFNIAEDGAPFVIIVNDQEGQRQITADTEAGKTPQVLVLGKFYSEQGSTYSWVWPKEKTPINTAYPTITNWLQNDPDDMSFIANPDEDQLYDGYKPNGGGTDVPADLEAVDLGLPSGTLWANMNVGATTPEEYGDYYAWGETTTKIVYDAESYLYCDAGDMFGDNHQNLGDCISGTIYDVATTLGDGWQMPTSAQFDELISICTVNYTTQKGVRGWKFTGTNNNSIFLPEAGDFESTTCGGEYGAYWSGTMSGFESAAKGLVLMEEDSWFTSEIPRIYGNTIRPVKAGKTTSVETTLKAVDLGLTSGTKWANMNVGANSSIALGDLFAWAECDPYSEMGSGWSMPTVDLFGELVAECTIEWTTVNGVEGAKFIGPNGNYIFMPANFNDPADPAYECRYWSSDFFQGEDDLAYALMYGDGYGGPGAALVKTSKYCVRAVQTDVPSPNYQAIDLGLPSGTKWANMNVGAMTPAHYGFLYAWGSCNPADQMGPGWSVPTKAQFEELLDKCEFEFSSLYLAEGVRITGSNGNSIFLPVSYYDESEGWWECRYWTKDSYPGEDDLAYALMYGEAYSGGGAGVGFPKTGKYAVRAVKK